MYYIDFEWQANALIHAHDLNQIENKYDAIVNPQIDTNGNICVKFGNIDVTIWKDGYVNATQLCKVNNSKLKQFKELPKTKEFIEELKKHHRSDFLTFEPIEKSKGFGSNKCTYVHP